MGPICTAAKCEDGMPPQSAWAAAVCDSPAAKCGNCSVLPIPACGAPARCGVLCTIDRHGRNDD